MAKTPKVTDAEVIASFKSAEALLFEMHDFARRIGNGHVDRLENPVEYAREFALIGAAATDMACKLLMAADIQKQRDELERLRRGE